MTIEECLAMAQRSLGFSDPSVPFISPAQIAICDLYARIAQAAALTAQAMMHAEQHKVEMMRHQLWIDNTFGEQIDPSEEVGVTVAFAGDIFDDETPV